MPVPGSAAERLVVAGTVGPTIHDVHAWRFRPTGAGIEVIADPARFRPMHDPSGRGLHLSCGAALVNLRLAAAQVGFEAVLRLRPEPGRPALLARARLVRRRPPTGDERLLYAAALRPFPGPIAGAGAPRPIVIDEIAGAARVEGADLRVLGGGSCVLTTCGDSPVSWLRAGRALQALLLAASARSAAATFLYESVNGPPSTVLRPGDVPQVLVELSERLPVLPEQLPIGRHDEGERHPERVG